MSGLVLLCPRKDANYNGSTLKPIRNLLGYSIVKAYCRVLVCISVGTFLLDKRLESSLASYSAAGKMGDFLNLFRPLMLPVFLQTLSSISLIMLLLTGE